MADEQQVRILTNSKNINLLTSLMPTLEGLILVTVTDGKRAEALIRYHQSTETEVHHFLNWLVAQGETTLMSEVQP